MRETAAGYGMALLATVIWSGNFVVARAVADMIPPWQCNFWRWVVAFVVCLPFAWRHIREDAPLLLRHWRYVSLMSLLGVSLMNTFFYKAGQTTPSLNMALIAPTAPIIILLLSRIIYGEPISPRRLGGMGVVRAGIVYYSLPLYAALAAWLVLGEAVIPAQVVGGLLIVGGIVTATLQTHRTPS